MDTSVVLLELEQPLGATDKNSSRCPVEGEGEQELALLIVDMRTPLNWTT